MKSENRSVVVDLSQQLGNQLFQLAAARQLELDGASVVFSDKTVQSPGSPEDRIARLKQLTGAQLTFATPLQEVATGFVPRTTTRSEMVNSLLKRPIIFPSRHRILRTEDYAPRPAALPDWSLYRIVGYFQHPSWFERSLAGVLKEIEEATQDRRTQLPSLDLGVHLRRGDYVTYGWELSFDYYVRSIALMPPSAKTVIVTSDDRLAARAFSEYLKAHGYDSRTSAEVETSFDFDDPVLNDFCLLANAQNLVMSNSTFCWWASVLGDLVCDEPIDRVVAYPRGWLGRPDESDALVRPSWTVVSA